MGAFVHIRYAAVLLAVLSACSQAPENPAPGMQVRLATDRKPVADCPTEASFPAPTASGTMRDENFCYPVGPVLLTIPQASFASASVSPIGGSVIDITIPPDWAADFEAVTRANLNKQLVILLDGRYVVAPIIDSPVTDGKLKLAVKLPFDDAKKLVKDLQEERPTATSG